MEPYVLMVHSTWSRMNYFDGRSRLKGCSGVSAIGNLCYLSYSKSAWKAKGLRSLEEGGPFDTQMFETP